ncbi:hypothetical protein [Pseudoalteromonas tunicata]|jgi:hypothetical protein|uniref:Uncharacterized protein n=1 Tax=Pseudoalteromonas tunicata D2 TaxID=87626 RepID=A4CFL4_9GAMM|nr:hypothetical protein [Pseudoalteromonas tunicata]ATC94118.1 hypothetical protein PTUN_a1497 [Pseudoalteromonas tunicata]AXT29896.1 hypothetical protein D1819_03040 [Pseudoalteromonas tunicata]EAR26441.1 hypothetical protein PTD2_04621 [Pseudoalteromonas tunicata D2]MDP4985310.1 hypothetical protein [Pseudoalteromonas tunicata]
MNKLALSFTLASSIFSTNGVANEQHFELKKLVEQEIKATITVQLTELQKEHAVISLPTQPILIARVLPTTTRSKLDEPVQSE